MKEVAKKIAEALEKQSIFWKDHFLQRMLQRKITMKNIFDVLESFEIIEEYLDDKPFPSYLLIGHSEKEPIHVVLSLNDEDVELYMITVYRPDKKMWDETYRRRKK